MIYSKHVQPQKAPDSLGQETADRELRQSLRNAFSKAISSPVFEWHSSSIAEDGTLLIFFDGSDGHTWGLTLDPRRPLAGQPATFRKLD